MVEKPVGLLTTARGDEDCLVARVRAMEPEWALCHPTSRLDRDVSGVVVFAQHVDANHQVLQARKEGRYGRTYVGFGMGPALPPGGQWAGALAIHPRDPTRRVVDSGSGKPSCTRFSVQRVLSDGVLSEGMSSEPPVEAEGRPAEGCPQVLQWLHFFPQTGRTHQLRVHAAHAGVPLVGDRLYGGMRRKVGVDGAVVRAARLMLHCTQVDLDLGVGRRIRVESALPQAFRDFWDAYARVSAP